MSEAIEKIGLRPPHPGAFVREEIIRPLGLTITRAAKILAVRRATLSDLLNEKSALSPEMALRIEKAFGFSMETSLRMQAWYDTFQMRQAADQIAVTRYVPDKAA